METVDAIVTRRSIRKYKKIMPPTEVIEQIISLGLKAPTPKANREPRQFYVIKGEKKDQLVYAMLDEILNMNKQGINTNSAALTCRIMLKVPIIVLCYRRNIDSLPSNGFSSEEQEESLFLVDIQSISASIQNMLLAATDMGLGSLWLGDVLYVEQKINEIVKTDEKLVAAVALGYPDHFPNKISNIFEPEIIKWM